MIPGAAWRPHFPNLKRAKVPRSERQHSSTRLRCSLLSFSVFVVFSLSLSNILVLFESFLLLALDLFPVYSFYLIYWFSDGLPLLLICYSRLGFWAFKGVDFGKMCFSFTEDVPQWQTNVLWSGLLQSIPLQHVRTIMVFRCKAQGKQGKPEVELLGLGHVMQNGWPPKLWGFPSCGTCVIPEVLDINVFEVSFFL